MVQSVIKGYDMIRLLLSYLPVPVQTFFQLALAFVAIGSLVSIIKYFLRGGGDS